MPLGPCSKDWLEDCSDKENGSGSDVEEEEEEEMSDFMKSKHRYNSDDDGDDYDAEERDEDEDGEEDENGDEEKEDDLDESDFIESKMETKKKSAGFIQSLIKDRSKDFFEEETKRSNSSKSNNESKKTKSIKSKFSSASSSNVEEKIEDVSLRDKKEIFITYRIAGSLTDFSNASNISANAVSITDGESTVNLSNDNKKGSDYSALNNLIGHKHKHGGHSKSKKEGHNHHSHIYAKVKHLQSIAATVNKHISNKMNSPSSTSDAAALSSSTTPQVIITDMSLDNVKSNYDVGLAFTVEGVKGQFVDHITDGGHCHFLVSNKAIGTDKRTLMSKDRKDLEEALQFLNNHKGYNYESAKEHLTKIASQKDMYGVPKGNPIATIASYMHPELIKKSKSDKDDEYRMQRPYVHKILPIMADIYNLVDICDLSSIKLKVERAFHGDEYLDKLNQSASIGAPLPDPWLDLGEISEKYNTNAAQIAALREKGSAEVTLKIDYIPVKITKAQS